MSLKEVLKPFRDTVKRNEDIKHFNPNDIIKTQFDKSVMHYLPIILKTYNSDMKYPKEWFTNLINRFGLEDVVTPESFNDYIQKYEKSTTENTKQHANDIINIRNELKKVTNDDAKGPRYLKEVKNAYDEGVKNSSASKTKKTESDYNNNGEPHANRITYLEKLKNNLSANIDKIVKPTVIASVIGSVTDDEAEESVHNIINRANAFGMRDYTRLDEFKNIKTKLDDIVSGIDEALLETDVKLETVELDKPKPVPKLEYESLPETDIEEVTHNPLQLSGINVDLIKPYKPNLQHASQVLFDQNIAKPNLQLASEVLFEQNMPKPELEIEDTDSTYENPDIKPAARMKKIKVVDQKGKFWDSYKDILVPELETASFPETDIDIEEVKPTPLQSSGINVDLIKPYKPNLQYASQILFDQSNVKPDEEPVISENDEENEISDIVITPDQSEEESVISDAMNTPEVPESKKFVSPKAYREGLKDYLENINARYLDFKQAFIDSGIITEDNLKELAGVPDIVDELRREFSDSTKQLTKDVVQDWNDKLKYIKDLIAKHGATMQKQYRLEAKLNTVDAKTEMLMKELKANSTLSYLLKLPTSAYEKLPDSIKKACELYREKQNELNNYIASRKKLIPKSAMNKTISKPVSSNVLNPMLKRGYQVFQ